MYAPSIQDLREAHERIGPHIHRTPVMTCSTIDAICGAKIHFKCENLQKVGAFKIRGASNAVLCLDAEQAARGVATHSSGNHGQALALAARRRGIAAHVVMPTNTSQAKKDAVAGYGARLIECEATLEDRERTLDRIIAETGATLVHPYNDPRVICGGGTAALELLEQVDRLEVVVAPIGGGGLIAGTCIAISGRSPQTVVIGAEPKQADDAWQSMRAGRIIALASPDTIADGLRTSLGDLTFPIIAKHVREIITVSEAAIAAAMRLVWERMKLIIEPSAAVPLAAIQTQPDSFKGKRVGVILTGGNADLDQLPWG
ncbi:MAG: pyridoxal-phosphate dependent enzyme [Deltaproteobacteria bacterium]|nr:pyridoxal-phosphate dependent enzyme [Deltaproteobacteria bacterium]